MQQTQPLQCLCINSATISPLIFPKYCLQKITPLLKDIATVKCAILPPLPIRLAFPVKNWSKPSLRYCQIMLLINLAVSKGLQLCWQPSPPKQNDIPFVQIFCLNIPLFFLENFRLSIQSFGFNIPFFQNDEICTSSFLINFVQFHNKLYYLVQKSIVVS